MHIWDTSQCIVRGIYDSSAELPLWKKFSQKEISTCFENFRKN